MRDLHGVRNDILDIEDFFEIYENRKEDYNCIKNINRKIIVMHLGGIIIECLVKGMICRKYKICKIKKDTNNIWYSEGMYDILINMENNRNQINRDIYARYALVVFNGLGPKKAETKNGHDFPSLIREHLNLRTDEVEEFLERVYNPLSKDKKCFIDLRYEIEDVEESIYDKWLEAFKELHRWLGNQVENIEIEEYEVVS